jgi:drug/metabolite transporter (DMT)-like permease
MKKINPGILALIGAVTIWGSTFVVTKFLMNDIGPFMVIGLRLVISLLVITPFAFRRGFQWSMLVEKQYILYGLTGIALYFGLSNVGLKWSTSANAALIQAAGPAVVALFSIKYLQEKITWQQGIGICLSILGVLLISGVPSGNGENMLVGNLLILVSLVSWSFYTIQGKKLTGKADPLAATIASFFTGLGWLLPFIVWETWTGGFPKITPLSWIAVAYLGIFASGMGFFLWNFALRNVDGTIAAPFINLIPILGLLFALLVGDKISLLQVVGGFIAIMGVVITQNIIVIPKGTFHEDPDSSH